MPVILEVAPGGWRARVEGEWGDEHSFDDSGGWDSARARSECDKWLARVNIVRVVEWADGPSGGGTAQGVWTSIKPCSVCGRNILEGVTEFNASNAVADEDLEGRTCASSDCVDTMLARMRAFALAGFPEKMRPEFP